MKKVFSLISFFLICFCLVSCRSNDITTSDIIISRDQVNNRMLYHEMRNDAFNSAYSDSLYKEEYQQYLEKVWKPTEEDAVIRELVEARILRQVCETNNITLCSRTTTDSLARKEFEQMKTDTAQTTFYNHLTALWKKHSVSEAVFLDMTLEYAYDFYSYEVAKQQLRPIYFNESSSQSLEEQFQKYTDKLVEEVHIQYDNGIYQVVK